MRPVRVRYSAVTMLNGKGWSYTVLAADSLMWLGEGWSLGHKRNCVAEFRAAAKRNGWIEREMRADRMRGAA